MNAEIANLAEQFNTNIHDMNAMVQGVVNELFNMKVAAKFCYYPVEEQKELIQLALDSWMKKQESWMKKQEEFFQMYQTDDNFKKWVNDFVLEIV